METLTHTEETLVETSTATCYFRTTLFFCLTAEHDCFFFVVCFFFSDVDECLSGPVCGPDTRCHNTNGSFYCSCQRDFVPSVGTKHFHPETGVRCKGWWEDICRKSTPAATDMFGWFVFFFFHAHSWLEAQDKTFLFFSLSLLCNISSQQTTESGNIFWYVQLLITVLGSAACVEELGLSFDISCIGSFIQRQTGTKTMLLSVGIFQNIPRNSAMTTWAVSKRRLTKH